MTNFYLAAAALIVAALLVLLRPWWLARFTATQSASETDAMRALNTAIYRDQIADLERDRTAGQLAETDYVEARDELQRRLLNDTRDVVTNQAVAGHRGLLLVLALLIPLAGAGLYSILGSPDAVLSSVEQDRKANATMEELLDKLAKKLEQNPENPEAWAMLARSYKALGRAEDAERAYNRIGPSLEQSATLLADLADLLVQKSGNFDGRPRELLLKALSVDPNHPMTLWLIGTAEFEKARYDDALKHWEHLLTLLEPGSEDAQSIASGIKEAKSRGGKSSAKVGAGGTAKAKPAAAPSGKTLSGRVELAPALRAKASPEDVVFIFARAEGGPPMPLAAIRLTAAELPYTFTLSDENALGGAKISTAGALRIEAKVAKGGKPGTSPGDLLGKSAVVKPGDKNLRILIDTVAP